MSSFSTLIGTPQPTVRATVEVFCQGFIASVSHICVLLLFI
jgi:hypothetical protein